MASKKGINPSRLRKIYERQGQEHWGSSYIPAILATPQEAPSISHASTLNSEKIGREVHVLSTPERCAALLALYHPSLLDLHEQKILSVTPKPHPLFGYRGNCKIDYPHIKGIADVAERLGYLKLLPKLKLSSRDASETRVVIFPYIGDLLLFLKNNVGKLYCVNWTVKNTAVAFNQKELRLDGKPNLFKENLKAIPRHEMETVYYADADIKTYFISGDEINWDVAANLSLLFGYHRRTVSLNSDQQQEILGKYSIALQTGLPITELIPLLCARGHVTSHDCRTLLYKSIWNRTLLVDLFSPVLIDRPLKPQSHDVIEVYAQWFKEQ